jgi:hypothetical protein
MGKKTFHGWPVREVSEGHGPRPSTSTSIDEACPNPNGNRWRPRNLDEDKEAHGECGFATAAQPMPSPQGEKAHPVQF